MHAHIVYCHPSSDSFTAAVKDTCIKALNSNKWTWTISDLYAMNFKTDMTEAEYQREATYNAALPAPPDVQAEQTKISACNALIFICPIFWNDVPAKLKGWFDRVWTFGFAYGSAKVTPSMKTLDKVIYFCSCGNTIQTFGPERRAALHATLIRDRIFNRARTASLVLLDGTSRELPSRTTEWNSHLATVTQKIESLSQNPKE